MKYQSKMEAVRMARQYNRYLIFRCRGREWKAVITRDLRDAAMAEARQWKRIYVIAG